MLDNRTTWMFRSRAIEVSVVSPPAVRERARRSSSLWRGAGCPAHMRLIDRPADHDCPLTDLVQEQQRRIEQLLERADKQEREAAVRLPANCALAEIRIAAAAARGRTHSMKVLSSRRASPGSRGRSLLLRLRSVFGWVRQRFTAAHSRSTSLRTQNRHAGSISTSVLVESPSGAKPRTCKRR
jgi:hypothetical protein